MPSHRVLVADLLTGSICVGLLLGSAAVKGQSIPATAGPQQMVPYGMPDPSTYPSTASAYPSTASAYPSNYASTGTLTISPPLTPYPGTGPAMMASVPDGLGGISSPSMPPEPNLPNIAPSGIDTSLAPPSFENNAYLEHSFGSNVEPWSWQIVPTGLMYKSYLAGNREPRMGTQWIHERNLGWQWDATLGGRVGILRYGTDNDLWPQGWQLDIEGAAFPRLNLEHQRDLDAVDFRAGIIETTRQGPWEGKFGYYHLSSHIGDEFLVRNPSFQRINYVRESLILGVAAYPHPSVRLYSEVGWAFYTDGGAKPWEFQFGVDCSPPEPTGIQGAPFLAINAHLRQENDFGGNLTVQTGWQWRGRAGHLCRFGMQYFNGMSDQYQFYRQFEEQIGAGLWYDY